MRAETPRVERPTVSLAAWTGYFLRLGTIGFGGPIALTAAMQRDLVELRGWITPTEYMEGLALAQLAPGPLAAQLAIYLGWVRRRVLGATVTGLAFVGPSLVMVLVLAWLYLRYGGLSWMQAAFYGIGAAVIAVIARGALKLAERTVGRDPLLALVMLANAAVVAWTARELLWVFVLSGAAVPMVRRWSGRTAVPGAVTPLLLPWAWWITGLHGAADQAMLARLFGYFAKAALVVFGSGLAVVPFLHGGVVESFRWLTDRQFLDAVAVSMITPGPVVITVAFIGYLVAGPLGGLAAALGIFLPTYLVVILVAPWFRRVMENRTLRSAVAGVTAAAAGAIAGAVVVLGRRALIDGPTWGIALLTLLLLWRARRIPEPALILAAGVAGLLLAQAPRRTAEWRVLADVPLPGPSTRFDYQSFDPATGRLWIAHMRAAEVLAFDVRTRQVVARVSDMPSVTGVLIVSPLQRVFAALSGSHQVAVLDARTGRVLRRLPGGRFPDGLAYAPAVHKIFVSDEHGEQELVIDAASSTALPPIPIGGEVGNTQYDSGSGRIWVAVQTRNQLAVIDPTTDSVVARIAVPGVEQPHGLLIDAMHRLAYVAGEGNGRVGVLDLRTNLVLGTYLVADGPDVLAIDPGRHRLFVAAESGVVAAFDIQGDSLLALPSYRAPHAHSVAVDPGTHLIYLPLENVGGRPVLRILRLGEP